jgi:SAM-dependent methyltransferase
VDELDADLTAYYDQEAGLGLRVGHGPLRTDLRERFSDLLRREGHRRIVDVGAGPGLDTIAFAHDGFEIVGVDLAPANVRALVGSGALGAVGSLYALPFRDAEFDALWTMSTFVHVPDARTDAAMRELCRVVRPGGVLGIGTWGGFDWEGISDHDTIEPRRYFSLAAHVRWRQALTRHGMVESFETWRPNPDIDWEYQFAVVRV